MICTCEYDDSWHKDDCCIYADCCCTWFILGTEDEDTEDKDTEDKAVISY